MVVRTRHAERGLSRRAIAVELRRRGIDDELAGDALEQVDCDDEEIAGAQLVRRKLAATSGLDAQTRSRRTFAALGRGVPPGLVSRLVREELAARRARTTSDADTSRGRDPEGRDLDPASSGRTGSIRGVEQRSSRAACRDRSDLGDNGGPAHRPRCASHGGPGGRVDARRHGTIVGAARRVPRGPRAGPRGPSRGRPPARRRPRRRRLDQGRARAMLRGRRAPRAAADRARAAARGRPRRDRRARARPRADAEAAAEARRVERADASRGRARGGAGVPPAPSAPRAPSSSRSPG